MEESLEYQQNFSALWRSQIANSESAAFGHTLFICDLQSVLCVIVCVIDRFHIMLTLKYSTNSKSIHQTNGAKELPQLKAVLWRSRIGCVWAATVWADCG